MVSFVKGTGYDLKHLVNNFPWDTLGSGTVVDVSFFIITRYTGRSIHLYDQVGGSNGFVSIRLASSFPKLHFIVQDLASTVDSVASGLPPELSDRVEFMPHDFFAEQPVKGADVYLFRWIFHNWSDEYCIKILRSLTPALKKGAMIVINDNVLPEPGTMGLWQEGRLRYVSIRISCQIV